MGWSTGPSELIRGTSQQAQPRLFVIHGEPRTQLRQVVADHLETLLTACGTPAPLDKSRGQSGRGRRVEQLGKALGQRLSGMVLDFAAVQLPTGATAPRLTKALG